MKPRTKRTKTQASALKLFWREFANLAAGFTLFGDQVRTKSKVKLQRLGSCPACPICAIVNHLFGTNYTTAAQVAAGRIGLSSWDVDAIVAAADQSLSDIRETCTRGFTDPFASTVQDVFIGAGIRSGTVQRHRARMFKLMGRTRGL